MAINKAKAEEILEIMRTFRQQVKTDPKAASESTYKLFKETSTNLSTLSIMLVPASRPMATGIALTNELFRSLVLAINKADDKQLVEAFEHVHKAISILGFEDKHKEELIQKLMKRTRKQANPS